MKYNEEVHVGERCIRKALDIGKKQSQSRHRYHRQGYELATEGKQGIKGGVE